MSDRYIVVSSDCHAGLLPEQYREYLDPEHREMFDMALPVQLEMMAKAEEKFMIKEINDQWRQGIEQELTGAWDHHERIKMLDKDGIAAEVIFPDGITEKNAPPFGADLGLSTRGGIVEDLQWAGAVAHNRWLAELCAQAPERHVGVGIVPLLWNVERAVEHARWCADNGLKSVLIPHMTNQFPCYHDPRYHPFWEACESLGLIVNFHSGAGPTEQYFGPKFPQDDGVERPGAVGAYISEVVFWTYRPLTFMLWGGVFEKYPKLKVVVTETGTAWMIPPWLRLLDHHYTDTEFSQKLGDFRSHLSMKPSEYFARNIAIGASCMPRHDAELRHQIGINKMMWGSDYPHPEGTWPHTAQSLEDTFRGLPEDDIADLLGNNAIDFYDLDRSKLEVIADRIGPRREQFAA